MRGVSRRHAQFRLDARGPAVRDLGSRNGVFVNGVRTEAASLRLGDEVRLGSVALILQQDAALPIPAPAPPAAEPAAQPPLHADAAVYAGMLAAGALVAQQVAGKAVRDALFLSSFEVRLLAPMMLLSSVVSIGAALGFSRALTAHPPAVAIPVAVGANAVLLGGEFLLYAFRPALAAFFLYLHLAVFGGTLVSGFWSVVSERFDPLLARRVVARIGLGASTGGALGGLLAWSLAGAVSMAALLATLVGLGLLALATLWRLCRAPQAELPAVARPDEGPPRLLLGLRILGEVPYLRRLALIVGLGAVSEALLDYTLKSEAARAFQSESTLVAFFAAFQASVALATLLAQATLVRASLETVGLPGTLALLPVVTVFCGLSGALAPLLATAALARGAQAVLQTSLFRAGYELLFTALPRHRKRPTKTIVDVGFDRLGGAVGAGLTLALVWLTPQANASMLFGTSVACALAALLLARHLHDGYVAALEESLLAGAVRLDPNDVVDATTRSTLGRTGVWEGQRRPEAGVGAGPLGDALGRAAQDLASGELTRVRRALLQPDGLDPRLASLALPWLARDEVSADAARALRAIGPRIAGLLGDGLLDTSHSPTLRRRVARLLPASGSERSVEALLAGLSDPDFDVRFACGLALRRCAERRQLGATAAVRLFEAAATELERPGCESVERERVIDHAFRLLEMAVDRQAVAAARAALREGGPRRGTALEYMANVVPEAVRRALLPIFGEAAPGATARTAEELERELLHAPRGTHVEEPRD